MTTMMLNTRAVPFAPSTWNAEARTVEATISTGADVRRMDARGPFIERLDLSGVDPAALIGLPVLADHRQGVGSTVGVIAEARREAGALVATIRFSAADDARDTVTKVAEGVLRGVSIGYAPQNPRETIDSAGRRTVTATPKIREVSLTPIPADELSQIRSLPVTVQTENIPAVPATPAAVVSRAAVNAQIRSIGETAGLDRAWVDSQIDVEATPDAARTAAFAAMQARSATQIINPAQVGADNSDPSVIRERQAEALFARSVGAAPSDEARQYMGLGLHDMARQSLLRSGVNINIMSASDILERAAQGTSDFPLLLGGVTNRVVLRAYGQAESPLKVIAKRRTVKDLRPVQMLQVGTDGELSETTEHGEIQTITLTESGESYRIASFARIIALSRAMLINDDVGAFADVATKAGQLVAEKEALLLSRGLTGAYKMRDGKNTFHIDHNNLAAAGAALSITSLGEARAALRKMKGLDGTTPVGVTPRFLVVGPDLETQAEQLLTTLAATKVEDQNVFAGKLQLVVDPRIEGKQWYVVADPASAPFIELAHLGAAPGPQITVKDGFETLDRKWRVILDAGVGIADVRGAYKNPGA